MDKLIRKTKNELAIIWETMETGSSSRHTRCGRRLCRSKHQVIAYEKKLRKKYRTKFCPLKFDF